MSTEFLDKALSSLNAEQVMQFFSKMPEKDRKSLAPRALEWLDVSSALNNKDRELQFYLPGNPLRGAFLANATPPKRIQRLLQQRDEAKKAAKNMPPQAVNAEAVLVAEIAVLATATLTEVKKREVLAQPEYCCAVLSARKPTWLQNWADWVAGEFPHTHWPVVRRLERAGVVQLEHNSNYLTGMALSLPGELADEELVSEIWRMLDDDQTMRMMLHRQERPSWRSMRSDADAFASFQLTDTAANRWHAAFVHLCDDGRLDKARLLSAIMTLFVTYNLEHSESSSTLKVDWFTAMHDVLQPAPDERFALHQDYLRLLACRNPKVVGWAADKIAELVEHPEFPVALVCESIPTAFLLKGKEHSGQALKALKAIADKHPSAKKEVAAAVIEALESESQDVQKKALTMLEKLKVKDDDLVARMQSKISRVSVTHRAQAMSWAGVISVGAGSDVGTGGLQPALPDNVVPLRRPQPPVAEPPPDNTDLQPLQQKSESIPADLRGVVRLDESFAAITSNVSELPSVSFCGDEIPRLDPSKRLKPLETIDDLIFCIARLLPNENTFHHSLKTDDMEIVLDGFARLGAEKPPDFKERTEAIRAKLEPMQVWGIDPVKLTAYAWITGDISKIAFRAAAVTQNRQSPMEQFAAKRFERVSRDIVQNRRVLLLSTPTHQGGWIDPLVLVDRLAQGSGRIAGERVNNVVLSVVFNLMGLSNDKDDLLDQSLALLRLAPENRAKALEKAKSLPRTELVDAVRYALGDDSVPIGKTVELWIAAARVRYPFSDDQKIETQFPGLGPDAARIARYNLEYTTETQQNWMIGTQQYHLVECDPAVPTSGKSDVLITVRMHGNPVTPFFGIMADWRRSITPMNLDAFFVEGIEHIISHDGLDSAGKPNVVYIEPLYDPDVPMTRMAKIMLALALSSKQKEEHSTAVEALIAAIDDGRLTGIEFGDIMHELHSSPGLRPGQRGCPFIPLTNVTRWAKGLATVAQSSLYHARAVSICVERLCQGDPSRAPKDLHLLLETLLSCLLELEDCVQSEETRKYLSGANQGKGASKTSKLIKQLLELKRGPGYATKRREALMFALEKKIERAERWTAWRASREPAVAPVV